MESLLTHKNMWHPLKLKMKIIIYISVRRISLRDLTPRTWTNSPRNHATGGCHVLSAYCLRIHDR